MKAPRADLRCKTCGGPGDGGGTMRECANCWEVEGRLDRYLQSSKGLLFVLRRLLEAQQRRMRA